MWTLIQLRSYLDCVSSRLGCKKIAAKFEEQQTLLKLQKVTPFVIRDNELFCLQTKRIKIISLFFFVLTFRKECKEYKEKEHKVDIFLYWSEQCLQRKKISPCHPQEIEEHI